MTRPFSEKPVPHAAPVGARRSRLSWAVLALGLALGGAARAVPPEVQVTPAAIPDYEFDSARTGQYCASCNFGASNSRFAFTDQQGNLWAGWVDFQTGDFLPADGKGVLLDTHTALSTDFGNGPEWVMRAGGISELVYTKYIPGAPAAPENAGIAHAVMANGAWQADFFANAIGRASPAGSLDADDDAPRIHYVASDKSGVYWRDLNDPDIEHDAGIDDITSGNARRWVPGTRKLIFQGLPRGSTQRFNEQILTYDTDTDEVEQLTFGTQAKRGAYMWQAPEFDNDYVFITMPIGRQGIEVYRQITGVDGVKHWNLIKTITTPAAIPFVWSPEVFTHNGRSYVFFQLSSSSRFWDLRVPTHLAISGIDPLRDDRRMLTDANSKPRVRLDPEYFITAQGPFIYYNRIVPETASNPAFNDGVWRIDTGLGAPR